MPRTSNNKNGKLSYHAISMDPIDDATAERLYKLGLKLANSAQIWAAVEEIKRGGGHSFEEILKDADAKKARYLRRRKRKTKAAAARP